MGEEKFSEKGAGFSSITIKKNNEKINMKRFFQLKVRSSIKTKRTEIMKHMMGSKNTLA